jgi:polyphosphate kinase
MTDSEAAPWWVVPSTTRSAPRINVISHILSQIPYERVPFKEPKLGKRQARPKGFDADIVPCGAQCRSRLTECRNNTLE